MSDETRIELQRSPAERLEDAIGLRFYRTLMSAPATLLAVKHSFYFNETYGESPQDRRFLDHVPFQALRDEIEQHLDDEVRHAALWRDHLSARGEMPQTSQLPFGDFVGMFEAAGWFPTTQHVQATAALDLRTLMAFLAAVHVTERQAVRQMLLFRRVMRDSGHPDLVSLLTDILRDEGRHMTYSLRGLKMLGEHLGADGPPQARRLLRRAQTAFLRIRAGDMRKIMSHIRQHDWDSLHRMERTKLRGLSFAIHRLPTNVPSPDGVVRVDAAAPLFHRHAVVPDRKVA